MAISPKAGAVNKVHLTRNVSSADMTNNSFGEALANAGEEVTAKMAKSPLERQGSTQGNVDAKEADIKDDMPEGTEAAMQNQQQGKEPKAGKEITTRDGGNVTQGAKAKDDERMPDGEDATGSQNAAAVVMSFTTEGKAALVMEEPSETALQAKTAGNVNLQSLLPQSGEDAQKNKNFLAMLSGQQVKQLGEKTAEISPALALAGQKAVNPNQQVGGITGNWQILKPATMLDVQLNNHQLANQSILQEANPTLSVGSLQEMNNGSGQNISLNQMVLQEKPLGTLSLENQVIVQDAQQAEQHILSLQTETANRTDAGAGLPLQVSAEAVNSRIGSDGNMLLYTQAKASNTDKQLAGQLSVENIADNSISEQELLNNLQTMVLNNGRERKNANGMAPFEQSETTMPSMPVGKVNDSVMLTNVNPTNEPVIQEKAGRVIVPEGTVQLQPRKEDNPQPVKNPLAGISITVEEVPVANHAMNIQQNPGHGNFSQQNQPQMPVMETVTAEDGEPVHQLAEEAAGDKAPLASTAMAQQTAGNASVSLFQQSLNENLTGAGAADEVSQPQNVQDDFNVPRQIVEQARLLRRGEDTQMVIKLHPDHLGELTLKVSVSPNGAVNASFHSDNAQVRAIIENTLVQLKQELNNQGLKVDNVDVYAGLTDGQLPQGEGQQAWQQNQGQHGSSIRNTGNVEDYGEETENIAVSAQSATDVSDGVDYRV